MVIRGSQLLVQTRGWFKKTRLGTKKNGILPFVTTCMDLEIIILTEETERQIPYDICEI